MKYKLTFTLGDPSWDGHGLTSVYYIVCNHSSEEIEAAYRKASQKLGFDFLKLFEEFECSWTISKEHSQILVENKVVDWEWLRLDKNVFDEDELGTIELDGEDEFVDIFFNIVQLELPDLTWDTAVLGFDMLSVLEGAGYGLFHL